jgi:hypothetical protein
MIPFFRKIRWRLAADNQPARPAGRPASRTGRYFKYALGEIILVVLGILIALQLNNLNELSKERKRELKFLNQIKEDLDHSAQKMGETAEFFFERAKNASYVTRSFWKPEDVVRDTLVLSLVNVFQSRREKPLVGTIESLINSGDINLISSDSLRNALIDYMRIVEANLSDIQRYDETYYRPAIQKTTQIVNYSEIQRRLTGSESSWLSYPSTISKIPFQNDYDGLMNNREIYNNYNLFLVAHRNQARKYLDLSIESEKLRNDISRYLQEHSED